MAFHNLRVFVSDQRSKLVFTEVNLPSSLNRNNAISGRIYSGTNQPYNQPGPQKAVWVAHAALPDA